MWVRGQYLLLVAAIIIFAGATLLCLLSGMFWWAENAQHFALQYVWLGALLAVWAWLLHQRRLAALFAVLVLFHAVQIAAVALRYSQLNNATYEQTTTLSILQFNASFYNRNAAVALAQLEALAPEYDLIVMQEYPSRFAQLNTDGLFAAYPYRLIARGGLTRMQGVAVFSKTPITTEEIMGQGLKSSYLRVTLAQYNIQFIALHSILPLEKALVASRNAQHQRVFAELGQKTGAAFAIGDFNQTPYASAFRQMLQQNNLHLAAFPQSVLPTWPRFFPGFLFRIPLDHVVMNARASVQSRRNISIAGSDHMAVGNVMQINNSSP